VELADSGGAFTNSEVTYRGVEVGRVGEIKLTADGVRLRLDMTSSKHIPRDTVALVANRSAVGEQYVDLEPRTDSGPYLDQGVAYTIPRKDTKTPVPTADLLRNVDALVASVNPNDLRTIVDELNKGFAGSAADLQTILDSSDRILKTANDNYTTTSALIDQSRTVLGTQRDKASSIKDFAANLALLTDEIRQQDSSLRTDISSVIPAVTQGNALIDQLSPTLPVLSNLTSTGQVIAQRLPGLRSLLILYPATLGGGFTTTPGDGTEHFGFILNVNAPAPCQQGNYNKMRYPQDQSTPPAKGIAQCTLPKDSPSDVRGTRNAPKPLPGPKLPPGATDAAGAPPGGATGGSSTDTTNTRTDTSGTSGTAGKGPVITPYQSSASNPVYVTTYDPVTGAYTGPDGRKYTVGSTGGQQNVLGDQAWKMLLLGPLAK
jgi:phospholipid/cholesterol/gamma-HCH transport system substrate-binding protein